MPKSHLTILLLTATVAALVLAACSGQPAARAATATVARGELVQSVSGSGQVKPAQDLNLTFGTTGVVAKVNVVEGQKVSQGDILASLDTADLDQQVLQAEANLKSAQAALATLKSGPQETDIRSAKAQLDAAQTQLNQQIKGNARASDVASAQAQLRSAQASLDALRNPSDTNRSAAQLKVTQAKHNLENTRVADSKAKSDAELSLQTAANALRTAQDNLSKIFWETHNADGTLKKGPNDRGYQTDVDNYTTAVRNEQDALAKLQQAQLTLDQAKQKESIDIANGEAQLADAQRQLDALLNPSLDQLAAAEAKVAQAQAQLSQLLGGTKSDVAVSQATVDQRQAALDALLAPPSEKDLAQAEANVAQAAANLAKAKLNRAHADVIAPFGATVAAVNIKQGDSVGGAGQSAAIALVDTSSFHVDVNISEADLARLEIGQEAQIELDALPGQRLAGTLDYIAPTATTQQNVTTYLTRVKLNPTDQLLRVGLSAAVSIITDKRTDAILVPNGAIRETDDGPQVQVRRGDQTTFVSIKTGLVGDAYTEVLAGLQPGDTVMLAGPRPVNRGPFVGGG